MKKILLVLCLLFIQHYSFSQFLNVNNALAKSDSINQNAPREKIFVHYDKPYYKLNDTLWLRGYIVEAAADEKFFDSSKIIHIDIWDNDGKLVKRLSTPASLGIFYNNITLTDLLFAQGNYTMRAYSNYMRNFGDSLFFTSSFKIIDPTSSKWNIKIDSLNFEKNKLTAIAKLMDGKKNSLANHKVKIVFKSGGHTLLSKSSITDEDGNIAIDTTILSKFNPEKLVLGIAELGDDEKTKFEIPITSSNQQKIDLQFLPEGGGLIAGLKQRLAFKAIDIYGHGVYVKGVIKDAEGNNIANFESTYQGTGIVDFFALQNKTYTAYLDNGAAYSLPTPKISGRAFSINRNIAKDSLIIHIEVSKDLYNKPLYFAATVRGTSYAKGKINMDDKAHILKFSTESFPAGVAHFTLYDDNGNAVNERAVLIWHPENILKLSLNTDRPIYANKENVSLNLQSTNLITHEAAPGNFSIAIVDTGQVSFPVNSENIVSYVFLSSDINGKIEDPGFYIKHPLSDTTDLLMLTQGWVNYNFSPLENRKYAFEKGFGFGGKVTNAFNKSIPSAKISLLGKDGSSAFLGDTLTDKNGRFYFDGYSYFNTDSVSAVVKALNKKGKPFNVGIEFDSLSYPPFNDHNSFYEKENIILDTLGSFLANNNILLAEQARRDGKFLENVTVTSKVKIQGSLIILTKMEAQISQFQNLSLIKLQIIRS